jgi:hypothetical protein
VGRGGSSTRAETEEGFVVVVDVEGEEGREEKSEGGGEEVCLSWGEHGGEVVWRGREGGGIHCEVYACVCVCVCGRKRSA